MKTLMIAMFFGPAFPLAYPITMVSILCLRYSWRYALMRVYALTLTLTLTLIA